MQLRNSPRFQVQVPVMLSAESIQGNGHMINLSLNGCALESPVNLRTGMGLQLLFSLPRHETTLEIHMSRVCWSVGARHGIEFLVIPGETQVALRRFLSNL